jgi:predicted RNA-binding Zn ribbon-like protein
MTPTDFLAKGHGKAGPWADLLNSEEWDTYGERTDHLDDPSWLPFFLAQWKFARPERVPFPMARFKALRSTLRSASEAVSAGRSVPEKEIRSLNDALNVAGSRRLCQRQNGLVIEFCAAAEGWESILAETALGFAELLARGSGSRIKICSNLDCRWVFYDSSKARTRRWCSDKVCGNRERVRRSRARARR